MRAMWRRCLAVMGIVLASTGVISLLAGPGVTQPATGQQIVLSLGEGWGVIDVDQLREGFSRGDINLLKGDFFDDSGAVVGGGYLRCQKIVANRKTFSSTGLCDGVAELEGGSIHFQGVSRGGAEVPPVVWAIIGGTGDYTGVGGTLTIEEIVDPEYEIRWTFDVVTGP